FNRPLPSFLCVSVNGVQAVDCQPRRSQSAQDREVRNKVIKELWLKEASINSDYVVFLQDGQLDVERLCRRNRLPHPLLSDENARLFCVVIWKPLAQRPLLPRCVRQAVPFDRRNSGLVICGGRILLKEFPKGTGYAGQHRLGANPAKKPVKRVLSNTFFDNQRR